MEPTVKEKKNNTKEDVQNNPSPLIPDHLKEELKQIRSRIDTSRLTSSMKKYFKLCCVAIRECLKYLTTHSLTDLNKSVTSELDSLYTGKQKKQSSTKTKKITQGGLLEWVKTQKNNWNAWRQKRRAAAEEEKKQLEQIQQKGCLSENQFQTRDKCNKYWYSLIYQNRCNRFNKASAGIKQTCNEEFLKFKSDLLSVLETLREIILDSSLLEIQTSLRELADILSAANQITYKDYIKDVKVIVVKLEAHQVLQATSIQLENEVLDLEEEQLTELRKKVQESKLQLESVEQELRDLNDKSNSYLVALDNMEQRFEETKKKEQSKHTQFTKEKKELQKKLALEKKENGALDDIYKRLLQDISILNENLTIYRQEGINQEYIDQYETEIETVIQNTDDIQKRLQNCEHEVREVSRSVSGKGKAQRKSKSKRKIKRTKTLRRP